MMKKIYTIISLVVCLACSATVFAQTDEPVDPIEPTECPIPTHIHFSDSTYNSVTISWTPGGEETGWYLVYGTEMGMGEIVPLSEPSYTLTNLEVGVLYIIWIAADCNPDVADPDVAKAYYIFTDPATDLPSLSSPSHSDKQVLDGQLLILRDGKLYNAQGARVK